MTDPDIASLARASRRSRRVPPDARCATCQTTRHLKLRGNRVLCYACRRAEMGAGPTELDTSLAEPTSADSSSRSAKTIIGP